MTAMSRISHVALVVLLASAAGPLAAASPAFGIEPFAGAQEAYSQALAAAELHAVPVDRISRVDGVMQPRTTRRVSGRLRSITWSHPRGVAPEAVFEHLRAQLDGEPWYACERRDCGPSTYWANRQFGVADLYGRDDSQYYVVVPRATAAGPVLTMLYVVQRGTREVLAHVAEIVMEPTEPLAADPQRLLRSLRETGVTRLPMSFAADGDAGSEMEPLFRALAEAAAELPPTEELWLVVHLRPAGRSSEATIAESRRRAQQLASRLSALTPGRKVSGYGVGALIPGVLGDETAVVQLVVQSAAD